MNRGDTSRRGSGLTPAALAFETPLRNEEELLDGLLTLSAKGQLRPETWDELHAAAQRDGRLAEVAFAYESVSQGKRLKALSGAPVADFLYEAGRFFADVFGDEIGAVSYLERAYAALPSHQPTFDRLVALLLKQSSLKKAADLYAGAASHRARADELEYLRKAADLYEQVTGFDDKVIDLLQQISRLDPSDEAARAQLEARYVKANRMRDVARLLEQALAFDPPPVGRAARKIHSRLLDVYANQLHEPERSIAHVEAILAEDPSDDEARKVAQKLVVVKGLAARAAGALAIALTAVGGTPPEIARYLGIELEHTRGPKRRDVLLRVGILKQERMNDDKGAFESYEQALAIDAADGVLRTRYAALASKMKKQLDAAKTLSRVSVSVKVPAQKAHLHALMGELLLEGGEAKRAKATFVAVLASAEAGPEATLVAGMALARMLEAENDAKALADVLDRVAELEPDKAKAQVLNERLAALAAQLGDSKREISAWQRLVDTPARATALAALEPLYEASGDAMLLASLLEERSKDATSVGEARRLAVKAAEARTQKGDAGAGAAWRSIVERFGPARDAYAAWVPILEAERDWPEVAKALDADANLAPPAERAEVLAHLGSVFLQRLKDVPAAIQAFRGALAQSPSEKNARAALETIAAAGEHRLAAAAVLEPVYRAEENQTALVKLLDLKASEAPRPDDRVAALEEAVALTSPSEPAQAIELAGRALSEAVANGFAIAPWLERIAALALRSAEPKRRATLLIHALGDRAIDSGEMLALARDAGDALATGGDPAAALAIYRRALAYEPGSAELISRVDDLLRDSGDPRERIALYRAALARGANAGRRRTLLHQIATIERDHLHDSASASATYAAALADDPDDSEAHDALAELLAQMSRWSELCDLLDVRARRAVGGEMRQARARLADVAAAHGEPVRAAAQCRILLADPALVAAELDVVDRVARAIGDPTLARDALRTRASAATDPRAESEYLERIGEIECDELADFDGAAATWKRAAAVAETSGDDERARELYSRVRKIAPDDLEATTRLSELCERGERWAALPPLYALLVERAPDATTKVDLLCKIARIVADKLSDSAQAAVQAARAFEIAPRDRNVIALFEALSVASASVTLFEHAVDESLLRSSDGSDEENAHRADLRLSRTRVLTTDPSRADDAAAAFRALVEEKTLDEERRAAALAGLEALVAARGVSRREDARWLFEWKLAHAEDGYKAQILLGWARAEEESLGDPKSALEIYRRVLALDDDDADALAATSRLALALGDVAGALAALATRRDRSEGAARGALDLEIAKILLDATDRYDDALVCVRAALDALPGDAVAIGLAARLLALPAASASVIEALDRAIEASDDPEARARILSALLDSPKDAAPGDTRLRWYDRLLDLHEQRGETDAELSLIARAASELPLSEPIWDRAERIARALQRPDEVATLYERALYGTLAKTDAMTLAQRAVAFYEEWFDAPARIVTILERVLDIDPTAEWAFDRLKLLFDAAERWDDLFALFDRALQAVRGPRRVELLEDAAQIAKDFAGRPDRATGYLEQLLVIHPNDARLSASLERLYERQSRHRELVALLTARAPTLAPAEAHATRARIASLWVDDLKDPAAALTVVEEILDIDPNAQPQAVTALLERILGAAPASLEMPTHASTPPRASEPPPRSRKPKGRADSVAPSPKRTSSVRQRAASLLNERYAVPGQEANLVRILEVELEAVKSVKERIRRHHQIATLYEQLANDAGAMEHWIALVTLEPDVASHRVRLGELAEKVGRFDRLAEVLAAAADEAHDEELRVELLMQAGLVHADRIGDGDRAIELFLRILDAPAAPKGATLGAARRVAPLLEAAARPRDRLAVLERIAALEPDAGARRDASGSAARLAESIGEPERAVAAWRARLDEDEADLEALDALVLLLDEARDFDGLIDVLGKRTRATSDAERRRADFVRMATVHEVDRGRIDDAIATWRALEAEFGEADDHTEALSRLLRAAEQWADVAVVLTRGAQRASDDRARAPFLRDLGDVQRERLDELDAAVTSYTGALQGDPSDAGARAGLHALLARDAQRGATVDALVVAYTATDEWARMLELVPHRLLTARDAPAKLAVLLQAAELSEQRAGDSSLAFEAMRRAFLVAPVDEHVAAELSRLAEATNGWRGYVDTHHEAIAALDAAGNAGEAAASLRMRAAHVLDTRLADARAALAGYVRILAEAPASLDAARAAVDVAARLSRWDAAAKVIADASRALGSLDVSLLAVAEASATQPAAWDALTSALAASIADRGDLAATVALGLEAKIAEWHRDRRGDPEAAEAAYQRALSHDALHADVLVALAQLQRRNRGRPLVDSLLRLSQATGGDLDLLREASEIALVSVGDRALAKTILDKLLGLARDRWLGSEGATVVSVGAPAAPSTYVEWALGELVGVYESEGEYARVIDLFVAAAALPFPREKQRAFRHRAAETALDRLGDAARAGALYDALFDEDPDDVRAVDQLVVIYASKPRELLALRQRQIVAAGSIARRVDLRLDAARLLIDLGEHDRASSILRENLDESPRDAATVAVLVATLEARETYGELRDLLRDQATLAETSGERGAAADLWYRAAVVAEARLADRDGAIAFHGRVIALEPRAASFDALAHLAAARGDHARAADHLESLRGVATREERASVTLRLADALAAAGNSEAAQARLEEETNADPAAEDVRARLAVLYEAQKQWPELARLLTVAAAHAPDKAARLARLREAASLFRTECASPADAVPLLEQASDLVPNDQGVRLALADALGAAQRYDDARTLLGSLVEGFGGRRPKERAPVHYQLAQLELAMGNRARALVELDAATRIDPASPEILRTLAELARDDGQLERAERSYRALLVVLRRQDEASEVSIARSEVLLELSAIAALQGENDRATEILESALEAAARSDLEEERLEAVLTARADFKTLARALEARIARGGESPRALGDLARLLSEQLGRPAEALPIQLRALAASPANGPVHEATAALARRLGAPQRYIDAVEALVAKAESSGDADLASSLLLRLGEAAENELKDPARATAIYERALALDFRVGEILRALDRMHARSGDAAAQASVLAQLVDVESRAGDTKAKTDAIYRLAALRLASKETVDEGCDLLADALATTPDFDRAEAALKQALAIAPQSERALELYESIGRNPGRERTLVDALARRAALPRAGGDALREAVAVARRIPDPALAESLLERFVAEETSTTQNVSFLAWATETLAELREAAGDMARAVELKRSAASLAEPEEARRLSFEIARMAVDALGDLRLAAETYEGLRERDPADREAWEPLLEVYRKLGDREHLAELLAAIVEYVEDPRERSRLRLERVRILNDEPRLGDDAVQTLREIVDEDPSQIEAAMMLANVLEREGRADDLAELLGKQLDAAKDRGDATSVASLAMRLGKLLEKRSRVEARNVYYAGLEWDASSRDLLGALRELLEVDGDPSDRADVSERLLALTTGSEAEKLALDLASMRSDAQDDDGAERALEVGFKAYPGSAALRARLDARYRDKGAFEKLAELCVVDAATREIPDEKVARLREAASIYRGELKDAANAARVLEIAIRERPAAPGLLNEVVVALIDAGDLPGAERELTDALDRLSPESFARAAILAKRAYVRQLRADDEGALGDLEDAFAFGAAEHAPALGEQLERSVALADASGNVEHARVLRLRLADVVAHAGSVDAARVLLDEMLKSDPRDRDALRALARLEEVGARWVAASAVYRRLVALEEDPPRVVETALKLADACERADRLGDARGGLERARMIAPGDAALRSRLEDLYARTGAVRERAELYLADARDTGDVAARFELLVQAGALLMQEGGDLDAAIAALTEARALRPNEHESVALLADALTLGGKMVEATELLNEAIAVHKGRRSRELASLYHRLARVASATGESQSELAWLTQALDMDSQNGDVASELATVAISTNQLDLANRALRVVTMLKTPGPMSKALAYQYMGVIARTQGDAKRAVMLLKRAVQEDPSLEEARTLLESLQGS